MKTAKTISILLLLLLLIPASLFAAMDSYCSAPPYVTRSVAPNIMVVIDNSPDMLTAAYTEDYDPAKTYVGYFTPAACYKYNAKFVEQLNTSATPSRTYAMNETCPSSAPFRGNLMNWATMSKYDLLQKVLLGGNSTSKQANANTLVSIGEVFADKTYDGCVFKVDNANLTITESTANACSLLDNSPTPIADFPVLRSRPLAQLVAATATDNPGLFGTIHAVSGYDQLLASNVRSMTLPSRAAAPNRPRAAVNGAGEGPAYDSLFAAAGRLWDSVDFPAKAYAAACPNITAGSLNATQGNSYTLTLTGSDEVGGVLTWAITTMPAWLSGPTYTNTYKTNGDLKGTRVTASWTGTATTIGNHPFSVSYTSNKCTGTGTIAGNVVVGAATLKIDTPTSTTSEITSGTVGVPYEYSIAGRGGIAPLSWSVTGLPAGLTINNQVYSVDYGVIEAKISGTPTTAGTYTVVITLSDSSADTTNPTRTVTLKINSGDLAITTQTLPSAQEAAAYSATLAASGGSGAYTWSLTSGTLPAGMSLSSAGVLSGTPGAGSAGNYPITVAVHDAAGTVVTASFTLTVVADAGRVQLLTTSPLPTAYKGIAYTFQMTAAGGQTPYGWRIVDSNPAGDTSTEFPTTATPPPGSPAMSINYTTGVITWTPTNNSDTTYTFIVQVRGAGGYVDRKTYTVTSLKNVPTARSATFNVKIDIDEEPLTDLNGNDIWDLGETFSDTVKDNDEWDGKRGIFQKFWDSNKPKARWGMTMFKDQGASTITEVATCVPANPVSSWYTGIQNATPADAAPLASGLYGAINYFGFDSPYGSGFSGCTNSDPIDAIPCRKNFILLLSSGSDTSGTAFASGTSGCSQTEGVVRNACVGYKTDLRSGSNGKQNIYTYVVNTMGEAADSDPDTTTRGDILAAVANAGGGAYYEASNPSGLEGQLTNALQDILSQAASGTAVSVLTTSSRGIGSMMQAYFLPVRLEGEREVAWTGYAQNIWIDPQDNLREDSVNDFQLDLDQDEIVKLYFDTATNQTKAARFTTSQYADSCSPNDMVEFDEITYTWEGGKKLALKNPSTRTLFTATNVIYGDGSANSPTFTPSAGEDFPLFQTNMDAALLDALGANVADPEAPFTAEQIVRYTRGECLETGVSGDDGCGATPNGSFRDRRVSVATGDPDGNVWKLGDIISSTPKVLANTPVNTYHLDYGDSSYYAYVSSDPYKKRSAMAFVGANDGVLHAFRVGYMKDTGLTGTLKAIIKNAFFPEDNNSHTEVGEEAWGYIPFNAFPYLKYLASPDYCHIYFNDLSVRLVDASLGCSNDTDCDGPADSRETGSWRTILVGGMRFGGACNGGLPAPPTAGVGYSSFFALDVTNAAEPIPLWEFSDPDLGYSTSFPAVIRTGAADKNGNWYVVVGSGSTTLPKSSTDIARTTNGYLYFLDLKTGALVKKVDLGYNAIVGDILAIDANKDYGSEKLYFGTAYKDGVWKGKVTKIDIPDGSELTSAWTPTVTNLFSDVYPFTASVDAAKDSAGNIWVYAGSGKYYSDVDEEDTANQIILGLKDVASPSPVYPWSHANLTDQSNVETTGTVSGTQQVCGFDGSSFGWQTVVTSISSPSFDTGVDGVDAETNPANGWFVSLTGGERVITRPLAVGGLVDFLTYGPSSDVCSYGGNSYLYAFSYTSGLAPTNVAIRARETTGGVTSGNVTVARGVLLGPGAPPTGEAIIIPPPKEGQEQLKKKIQIATGVIVEAENTPVLSVISKIVHWLRK